MGGGQDSCDSAQTITHSTGGSRGKSSRDTRKLDTDAQMLIFTFHRWGEGIRTVSHTLSSMAEKVTDQSFKALPTSQTKWARVGRERDT